MTGQSIIRVFRYAGACVHPGPVESGVTIIAQGDCTIEGPIGDDVCIQAEGDVILRANAGNNLRVMATGSFQGKALGERCDVSVNGMATTEYLGYGSAMSGMKGVSITNKEVSCGEYSPSMNNGVIQIRRKWPSESGGANICELVAPKPAAGPQ